MQRDRQARLRRAMGERGVETLVLLGNDNVAYATGARWPLSDPGRANVERPVAVVTDGDERPHLFTADPERTGMITNLPADHLHGPVFPDVDEGARLLAAAVVELHSGTGRVAVDELTGAMGRAGPPFAGDAPPASADEVVGAAKLVKTPDELAYLRQALAITEQAIAAVQADLVPGARQVDLTGTFLRAAFDLGADANILDPIFQVMPSRLSEGPWTTHGDIACPLVTTERQLVDGDVIWVDTGLSYGGFTSDFGRTWVVGRSPSAAQEAQFHRWRATVDAVLAEVRPGATGADMTRAARAAADSPRPWMEHFYLAHGLGIASAEPPFIGTDLGDAYDERQTLSAGMVVVLEPLVWEDGVGGYRSEEVVVVTDDGWAPLTDYPYDPYGH